MVMQPQPQHAFLGFQISEWAGLIAIVTGVVALVVWLVRTAIVNPIKASNELQAQINKDSNDALRKSIDALSVRVEGIGMNVDQAKLEHDHRLDQHDIQLAKHDEEIRTLFKQSGKGDE